jgi:hypothetical protein
VNFVKLLALHLQVAQNGLEILCYLAERMKEDFRPYISTGLKHFLIEKNVDRNKRHLFIMFFL